VVNKFVLYAGIVMSGMLVIGHSEFAFAQEDTEADVSSADFSAESETVDVANADLDADALETKVAAKPSAPPPGTVSIDFKDADVRQVLRILSLKSGVDIVAGVDVEGLVTIKLTNVAWEKALDIILRTYGFTYEREGNIVRVMPERLRPIYRPTSSAISIRVWISSIKSSGIRGILLLTSFSLCFILELPFCLAASAHRRH